MIEIVQVSLENEMDLTLAYKKSIKVAEMLGLTVSTQTAFATAVSEVSREIIDKTFDGKASIAVEQDKDRYLLTAQIFFRYSDLRDFEQNLQYAKKLVPVLELVNNGETGNVKLQLSIPRSAKLNRARINLVKHYFDVEEPATPYEEVRMRNLELSKLTEEQQLQLKQSNYLNNQKNEFLSVASHELKNPLTIIKAYAQLALSVKEETSPAMSNYLKKIELQSSKLHALIQQLFDISKIESGQFDYKIEQVNINHYLNEIADLIKYTVPSHQLNITLSDDEFFANIDKIRIEQVLSNLIGNAAKYSSAGSEIDLKILKGINNDITIVVKDKGIGMNEEVLTRVFDKFYRSEDVLKKYTGLGMGLYIASKIISDHGGKIWAESKLGEGSSFYFSLPTKEFAA